MKKLLTILMLLTASLPLWAYDLEVDGIYYNKIVSTSTVQVTNYDSQANSNSYSGTVVIPETVSVNGVTYKVTSIGAYAFVDCENLTAIEIPGTVTEIGTNAFLHCYGLSSVTIADGETTLELANYQAGNWPRGLFFDCPIETLYLGRDLSYDINTQEGITRTPFSQITELTTLTIGNNVTKIGVDAFVDCSGLTSVIIPNNITSIGGGAFEGCTGLTEVIIPESVQQILGNTFKNCTALTSVTIPNSVTSIGNYAFEGCTKLSTITCNATTPPAVEENSFSYYDATLNVPLESLSLYMEHPVWSKFKFAITTLPLYYKVIDANNKYVEVINDASYASYNGPVIIPSTTVIDGVTYTVTSIKYDAFRGCTGLTLVAIPDGVTSIGYGAFYGCNGLTSITIPNSVTSIGSNAFYGCTGLREVIMDDGETTLSLGMNGSKGLFADCPLETLYYGRTLSYNSYNTAILPFGSKTTLTSVIIGNSVTSIGNGAFYGCTGLTEITIPNSVTSIGESAFQNCTGLTEITLGNGVTSIGGSAFTKCSISNIYFDDIATICNGVWSALPRASSVNYYYNNELLTELVIPEGVTMIGNNAFQYCTSLTSVTIPESVTSIGSNAFDYCTGLTEVTIPDGVTSIGDYAFQKCTGLTEVTIGNGVTSIGGYAFDYCTGLTEVTIGNGVTSIGERAFRNCTGLTSISLGNGVTSIGTNAFSSCSISNIYFDDIATICNGVWSALSRASSVNYYYNNELLTELVIPDSITSIGRGALYGCTGLTSITIPNSVTSIGDYALYGCTGLTEITIPNSVTSVGNFVFNGCTALKEVRFIDGNSTITLGCNKIGERGNLGKGLFYDCPLETLYLGRTLSYIGDTGGGYSPIYNKKTLTSVTIGDSVTSIGNYAFQYCTGLTSITIPNSVTSIGYFAFDGCTGLTEVTIGNGVTSIGNYAFRKCTGLTSITIPESVTSIGYFAFENCTGLTEVTIGNGVTSIGLKAFYGCTGLTKITLGNGVTSIGDYAFYNCKFSDIYVSDIATICKDIWSALPRASSVNYYYNNKLVTELVIPEGVTSIGGYAFSGCTSLTEVTIPNSVTSIGIYAFLSCKSLTSITIPNSVTSIGNSTFMGCTGLTEITIPNSVTSIEGSVFWNCTGLTSITIPENVTSIRASAFRGCTGLTSITIPDGVTSIEYHTFDGCTGLTEITIPNSVTSIGTYALYGCTGLTSITIPDGVTSIDESAFQGCTGLTSITIPNSVTSIDNNTFSGCTGLTSVTLGNGVTSIGNSAFSGCTGLKEVIMEDGEAVLNLGNNNRKGLFNDCPIHTLYLGRTLSYDASSSGGYSPFYNQIYLKNLTIGNIRILSENLFNGCSNLVGNLTLSSSIDSIASNAFASTQYTLCRIQAKEPPVVVDAAALGNITFVRVPQGSRAAYKAANVWKDLTIVEEDPEYEVEITVTEPGKLSQDIVMEYMIVPQSVTKLKVHGTINVEDFKQMRTNMTSCYSIDLSDADCVALPDSAFEGKYYLTELILPNNCTSIGKAAFVNCSTLDSIVIPDNVSIIGERAFMNCKGLKFMGSGRYLSIIGEYAFQNCILLDNVTLPTGLKTIERYAFENCSTLTSIVIPNGVTSLGAGAFKNCISLVSASIPGTVEVVESYTFDNCKSLKELTLGEGVKTLSENAVRSGNFETFIIPSSLTNLGATSLSSTKIKKLIISDSENELYLPIYNWVGAFPNTGITYLYIGRDWRYQNAAASNFPTTITSVEIGPQVTTLKKIADCPNLKTLSVSSLNHLLSLKIESHPFATSGSGVLYIDGEAITNVVIPDNITAIKDYTFLNCTNIEAVTLPDSITTIGNQAFKGCTSLTTVNLSDTLQSLGNEAFYGCSALANITCPALVPPTVGTDGFEGVDNYTCILTIPGDSLMNYMLAEHWGAFIQKRKRIDVDVETPVVDEGESEGEGESGSEGDGNTGTGNHCGGHIWYDRDWHKHHGGHHAPRRYAAAEEETAVSGIDATIGDGLSLFIATDSVVTFLIEPEEGYNIGSVRYGGVDVTDQLNNGVFTTSAVSANTKLEVSFVEGEAPVVAGDANDDATVNISDVVVIVNYILGDESGVTSVDNADVNEDGVINIGDVPGVVNIILSASVQAAPIRYEGAEGVLSMNDVIIAQGETTGIEVSLDNAVPYTAFQMDVTLPEGLTANNITLSNRISSTHSLMWRMQEDNTLRVVVFAPDNSAIADNSGALFTIDVTAGSAFEGGHIVADNTIFTARDLTMHYLDGAEAAAINPAGVDGIYTADRIYTIGRTLVIESTCNQAAYITTTGGVMRAVELQAGRNEIAMLQQGLYIVVVGSETQKVIIR